MNPERKVQFSGNMLTVLSMHTLMTKPQVYKNQGIEILIGDRKHDSPEL